MTKSNTKSIFCQKFRPAPHSWNKKIFLFLNITMGQGDMCIITLVIYCDVTVFCLPQNLCPFLVSVHGVWKDMRWRETGWIGNRKLLKNIHEKFFWDKCFGLEQLMKINLIYNKIIKYIFNKKKKTFIKILHEVDST